MVDLMNMKFFECYSCRRVLMFKSDRNTGKRKCITNNKQIPEILTIPEISEKKLRKNGKEKSGKMKSQTGHYTTMNSIIPRWTLLYHCLKTGRNDTRFSHCLWEKVTFAPRKSASGFFISLL